MAQVDCFLKIDGVEAESTDDKHKGEIEVESFSWGETQSGTAGHGGGGGAGKVSPADFSFVKKLDKSSPVLMIGCATGQHYKTAILTVRKAGGGQQDYLKISMEDIIVSSYKMDGRDADFNEATAGTSRAVSRRSGGVVPEEHVTLNFAKLEISYKEQKADGSLGGEVKQKYDFAANKKV